MDFFAYKSIVILQTKIVIFDCYVTLNVLSFTEGEYISKIEINIMTKLITIYRLNGLVNFIETYIVNKEGHLQCTKM